MRVSTQIAPVIVLALGGACAVPCEAGPPGTICTVVGSGDAGFGGDGGPVLDAALFHPIDVELDADGRLWVLDWSNHRVRRVEDGTITAVVGTDWPGDGTSVGDEFSEVGAPGTEVSLNHPTDLVFDPETGDALLSAWHNHKLRSIGADDRVRVLAGSDPGFSGDGGPAIDALLEYPHSAVTDGATVWMLDNGNRRLRRISDGTIETVAGTGELEFNGDGPAMERSLGLPDGGGEGFQPGGRVRLTDDGALWLAEPLHRRIRRFDPATGMLTTAFGGDDGVSLQYPNDVHQEGDLLWVLDRDAHAVVTIDLGDGAVTTVVGGNGPGWSGDGGPADQAQLNLPTGFHVGSDAVWIADYENNVVRKVLR